MSWAPHLQRVMLAAASLVAVLALGAEETKFDSGQLSLRIKAWTTDDGLPLHGIRCLKQTRDGYLWIGTWYGLARFDGSRFKTFDKFDTPELVNDTITSLTEDSSGTLWIGTGDGLVRYREGQFRRFTQATGLFQSQVWRVVGHPQ